MSRALALAPARAPTRTPATARAVSRPHDASERQAARAADVVARGGSVAGWSFASVPLAAAGRGEEPVRRSCGCGPACTCHQGAGTAHVDEVLAGPGVPLDRATRRVMEAGFGHDFARVRLHADGRAAASARALDARAYAVGDHVVTADGPPSVATEGGRRLLAHELAHVVQQSGARDVLQRQPAGAAPAPAAPAPAPTPPAREERLNLGRGGGRVDAVLDRAAGLLTVSMKVLFAFLDAPRRWPSAARKAAWQADFIRAVERRWSFKHLLVPAQACAGAPEAVRVQLRVVAVAASPHFTMNVGYTEAFRTSSVGGRTATMDALDTAQRSDQPQTPADHEFGHMLGLPHVRCDRNDSECYGVSREEKADVMGMGSYVSPRAYEPFAELMPYFTACNYRVRAVATIPTSRGPLIGGIVGGLLGAAAGAGLGFLAGGPIGAIVGGILGLVGGAYAGSRIGTPEVPS